MSKASLCSIVFITSFIAGKVNSSPIVSSLPDLAISRKMLYEARNPSSSCSDVVENILTNVGSLKISFQVLENKINPYFFYRKKK